MEDRDKASGETQPQGGARSVFCPQCGADNLAGSRFCKICGTPLSAGGKGLDANVFAQAQLAAQNKNAGQAQNGGAGPGLTPGQSQAGLLQRVVNGATAVADAGAAANIANRVQPGAVNGTAVGTAGTASPRLAVNFADFTVQDEPSAFAAGLPSWNLEPPQVLVRRPRR